MKQTELCCTARPKERLTVETEINWFVTFDQLNEEVQLVFPLSSKQILRFSC